MAISETKKKIVIDNYFKSECNVDTSIREAFAKGFEIGLEKGAGLKEETIEQLSWNPILKGLPIEGTIVEVTILENDGDIPLKYTSTGWHHKGIWIVNNEVCYDVIAWKPLSKAYEGDC